MQRLISASVSGTVKEQQYVDTAHIKVTQPNFDVELHTTKNAGTVFRDLLVTEGQIKFGDILYLIKVPDIYQKHSI